MNNFSPYSDNVMYESLRESNKLDWYKQSLIDQPRRTVQITCGAQAKEAKEYALDLKRNTPTQNVIYRVADDDDIHKRVDSDKLLQRMIDHSANGELISSYNNEPGTSLSDLIIILNQVLHIAPELRLRGITGVFLNLSTGAVDNIENEVPETLISIAELLVKYDHFLGWHDYLNTQFWPDNTYTARYKYLKNYVPDLRVMITETGFDSHAPNPQLNGWKTHKDTWAKIFPGIHPEMVYWNELVKGEMFYKEDDVDLLVYSLGYDPTRGPQVGSPFDYQDAPTFYTIKNNYRRSVQPMYEAFSVLITGMPSGVNYRNIRTAIKATSPESDIGDVRVGDVLVIRETTTPDWYEIDSPVHGYIYMKGVEWTLAESELPDQDGFYVVLPESRFRDKEAALSFVELLRNYADAIAGQVNQDNSI